MADSSAPARIRDPDRTRRELLAVATEVFAESGYSGARVDKIAERTRTTKRMIYYYFGGKEGLYLAALEAAYLGIRQTEKQVQVDDLEPVDALRHLAELTFDHHHAHRSFVRLVAIENIHRGSFVRRIDHLREKTRGALTVLDEILAAGRAEGQFRSDVDAVDVHMTISAYCVFQIANSHTFGFLFDRDMSAAAIQERHRSMLSDLLVAWLTARPRDSASARA